VTSVQPTNEAWVVMALMALVLLPACVSSDSANTRDKSAAEQFSPLEFTTRNEISFFRLFGQPYGIDRFERSRTSGSQLSDSKSRRGRMPVTGLNFDQATRICADADGRICNHREWAWACRSSSSRKATICGSGKDLHPTGIYCPPEDGLPSDMRSNAKEWAVGPFGNPLIVGLGNCRDFRIASPFKRSQRLGVRCCY